MDLTVTKHGLRTSVFLSLPETGMAEIDKIPLLGSDNKGVALREMRKFGLLRLQFWKELQYRILSPCRVPLISIRLHIDKMVFTCSVHYRFRALVYKLLTLNCLSNSASTSVGRHAVYHKK